MICAHRRPRIVLAVTTPISLKLMTGFPEHLASRGWDVHLVTAGSCNGAAPPGVVLHSLHMVREPSPLRDAIALVNWIRLLSRLRPDAVVAGTPKAGLLGMLAAWGARVPVRIYLLRGLRLETEAGLRRRVLSAMEWLAAKCSTRVQAVSQSLREEFVTLGLAPESKVIVLGAGSSNGVEVFHGRELERVTRSQLGLREDLPLVGFVGRMTRDKGLDTLLQAVRFLRERGTHVQVLLIGPEEPKDSLGKTLQSVGLPASSVTWIGSVPDARPYMGTLDVLCLPTRREGFPNVVLEAAVQGVPAIVSDVTGARDAIVNESTGLLFPVGDSKQLSVTLERVIRDPAWLQSLGRRAKVHVTKTFNREAVWRLNEDFFASQITAAHDEKAVR